MTDLSPYCYCVQFRPHKTNASKAVHVYFIMYTALTTISPESDGGHVKPSGENDSSVAAGT